MGKGKGKGKGIEEDYEDFWVSLRIRVEWAGWRGGGFCLRGLGTIDGWMEWSGL